MKYVIQIQNGQPVGHPIAIENFKLAFPDKDLNNLSPDWAEFCRILPSPNKYQTVKSSRYDWINGVVSDVWEYNEASEEDKKEIDRLEALTASIFNTKELGVTPNVIG